MKQIPNLFTLLNLVFGIMAIVSILQTGEMFVTQNDDSWMPQLPERIWLGSLFIGLAAVVDFLDGFIARLFKATSDMGGQLDSLADVVSFGVAPSLILYQLLRLSFMQESDGIDTPVAYLLPAAVFACAGAWRLARFNVSNDETSSFTGVPIPAAGVVVASLPLILFYDQFNASVLLLNKWFLYMVLVLLSVLMVSRWKFMSIKFSSRTIRGNLPVIVLAVAAVVGALLLQWLAVPLVFVLYIVISITTKKNLQ